LGGAQKFGDALSANTPCDYRPAEIWLIFSSAKGYYESNVLLL